MRELWKYLFQKRQIHVKPLAATSLFGWQTLELTPWQSFRDDCRRYGLKVALHNLRALIVGYYR